MQCKLETRTDQETLTSTSKCERDRNTSITRRNNATNRRWPPCVNKQNNFFRNILFLKKFWNLFFKKHQHSKVSGVNFLYKQFNVVLFLILFVLQLNQKIAHSRDIFAFATFQLRVAEKRDAAPSLAAGQRFITSLDERCLGVTVDR